MVGTLEVRVNYETRKVSHNIETASEFLEACDYDPDKHTLYRETGKDVPIGPLSGMLVFDDGDEFTVIPKYCSDGG